MPAIDPKTKLADLPQSEFGTAREVILDAVSLSIIAPAFSISSNHS